MDAAEAGSIECAYCGSTTAVAALTGVGGQAAPPERSVDRLRERYGSPAVTIPLLAVSAAFGAGLLKVGFVFRHGVDPRQAMALIVGLVAIGLGALLCALIGQKIAGVLLLGGAGAALVAKPWLVPPVDPEQHVCSPMHGASFDYLCMGAVALALAGAIALSLRRADLRPCRPRWFLVVAWLAGLGVALGYHLRPSRIEWARSHAARLDELRETLRAALERAPNPGLDLDPPPRFVRGEPQRSTLSWLPRAALEPRGADPPSLLPYYHTFDHAYLFELVRLQAPIPDVFRQPAPERWTQGAERTLATPYVGVFEYSTGTVRVHVLDARRGEVIAQARGPCEDDEEWRVELEARRALAANPATSAWVVEQN